MANSLYENNANFDEDLSPVTPMFYAPAFQFPIAGICDTVVYLGKEVLSLWY